MMHMKRMEMMGIIDGKHLLKTDQSSRQRPNLLATSLFPHFNLSVGAEAFDLGVSFSLYHGMNNCRFYKEMKKCRSKLPLLSHAELMMLS